MENSAAAEAPPPPPPPQEGGSGDPSPDSSAASGNHQGAAGAEAAGPVSESDLILDTAAPVHATGDERLLSDARGLGPGDAAASMTRRDGTKLLATAVGVLRRGTTVSLPDVRCFPGLPPGITLVSVGQLSGRGLSFEFRGSTCVVRDGNTVVGEGQLRDDDGFYHLDFLRVPMT